MRLSIDYLEDCHERWNVGNTIYARIESFIYLVGTSAIPSQILRGSVGKKEGNSEYVVWPSDIWRYVVGWQCDTTLGEGNAKDLFWQILIGSSLTICHIVLIMSPQIKICFQRLEARGILRYNSKDGFTKAFSLFFHIQNVRFFLKIFKLYKAVWQMRPCTCLFCGYIK